MSNQLDLTIRFWESKLQDRLLLGISNELQLEFTIQYLKELKDIKDKIVTKDIG
jgi:hypothetical protein